MIDLKLIEEKYPKAFECLRKWVEPKGDYDLIEKVLYLDHNNFTTISDYEFNGLIQDFFDDKKIFISVQSSRYRTDFIKDEIVHAFWRWVVSSAKEHGISNGYIDESRQESFEKGIDKCFEILEKQLEA